MQKRVLEKHVGTRGTPKPSASPWSIVLNNGAVVSLWPDGRAKVTVGSTGAEAAARAEQIIETECGAKWLKRDDHAALGGAVRVRYGIMSGQAQRRQQGLS